MGLGTGAGLGVGTGLGTGAGLGAGTGFDGVICIRRTKSYGGLDLRTTVTSSPLVYVLLPGMIGVPTAPFGRLKLTRTALGFASTIIPFTVMVSCDGAGPGGFDGDVCTRRTKSYGGLDLRTTVTSSPLAYVLLPGMIGFPTAPFGRLKLTRTAPGFASTIVPFTDMVSCDGAGGFGLGITGIFVHPNPSARYPGAHTHFPSEPNT
ncbi:hypothetical protein ATCV1_z432R [Acanthocystis turfacea chlorella virus 1]|uniref:Uncharacterized protein z432R n=1 Tax=Chlorovirus heliozoae TaxID=322019 RepID=A7K942_9PHYC|nr:hypothetical protein ATCV1_z432R [Acanthocystis turfacea chlorella virus 1]ABT16566.1 hypothetical protein ATCV1_z432R [Acanthocystis turfacea chlorella virus 1]